MGNQVTQQKNDNKNSPVLLLSEVYPPKIGGSGRFLSKLAEASSILSQDDSGGYDWQVIASGGAGAHLHDRDYVLPVTRVNLTFMDWGFISPMNIRDYARAVRSVIERYEKQAFDHVLCARAVPEGWIARRVCKRMNTDYAVFTHGEELNTYQSSRQLKYMSKRVYRGAKFIIANSENTRNRLLELGYLSEEKIHVITPGCDVDVFKPLPDEKAVAQTRVNLGLKHERIILTAGRLTPRKGQLEMIYLLKKLKENSNRFDDVVLVIIGDGETKNTIIDAVKTHELSDHVRVLGATDHETLLAYYQVCDVFCLPNRVVNGDFEGFGIVCVEAQSCGKPVICGVTGGTPETIEDNVTGLSVDPENEVALLNAIQRLLDDPDLRNKMGHAGRERALARYDWLALGKQFNEVLCHAGW